MVAGTPLYCNVILPLPLPELFTYSIPPILEQDVLPGKRVSVQFGKKKIYSALIRSVHSNTPSGYKIKAILSVLDDHPVVNEKQFSFWEWIASYYACTIGEVLRAALPSGLTLESETRFFFNPGFLELNRLEEKELSLLNCLEKRHSLTIMEIHSITGYKNSLRIIKSLYEKGAVTVEENLIEKYKPREETWIRLNNRLADEQALQNALNSLSKAPKQLDILMKYISLSDYSQGKIIPELRKKDLLASVSSGAGSLNGLVNKDILQIIRKESSRLINTDGLPSFQKSGRLTQEQEKNFHQINELFSYREVVLLHGVTSGGKTEIYIKLIAEYIEKGMQVLYLLPEIALASQIIYRLIRVFGDKVGIYHSKCRDAERVEIWKNILQNGQSSYRIIVGVRSSVFLPFSNLGLIIVDEEHENAYKQFDPAPRYHARDAAIVLASLHRAKTLLGTATPSLETYYNAKNNKYGLAELKHRYLDIKLPEIIIADTKAAYKKNQMKSHFTPILLEHIEKALNEQEQVILFQNRRGFSPYLECMVCHSIPKCKYCDVCLTYHKQEHKLVCHYCGYSSSSLVRCGICGNMSLFTKGFGTEKIEEEIPIYFPAAKVARLDLDSTHSVKALRKIISDFEEKQTDILVGTQMVCKGLDFDHVSVVGIMNADNMLNFPDFRAFEKSFQLMAQVSGRAGRKNKRGKVIIQTANPGHPVISKLVTNDLPGFYQSQLMERKEYHYPPFYRLVAISIRHKKPEIVDKGADTLSRELKPLFGSNIYGPVFPYINKIKNRYIKNILIKIEKNKPTLAEKINIRNVIHQIKTIPYFKHLEIILDVDPK